MPYQINSLVRTVYDSCSRNILLSRVHISYIIRYMIKLYVTGISLNKVSSCFRHMSMFCQICSRRLFFALKVRSMVLMNITCLNSHKWLRMIYLFCNCVLLFNLSFSAYIYLSVVNMWTYSCRNHSQPPFCQIFSLLRLQHCHAFSACISIARSGLKKETICFSDHVQLFEPGLFHSQSY